MAFTEYTGDTTIIGALGTNPSERALTTQQFKDKFDQFAKEFVTWFNATHIAEADAHLAETVSDVGGAHGLKVEKGSFTPTIGGATTPGVNTYSRNIGHYIKIGDLVQVSGIVTMTAKDPSLAGTLILSGLPFPVGNLVNLYNASTVIAENITFPEGRSQVSGYFEFNTSRIVLIATGAGVGGATLNQSNLANNSAVTFSAIYRVA